MGKRQYYLEDLLLEAVIKYAYKHEGKIKATELAEWARSNIKGLAGVRDYHFTRPVREKDEKTGKVSERPKSCKIRIDEINEQRSRDSLIGSNVIFKSNPEELFNMSNTEQRRIVVEARDLFWKLNSENAKLNKENIKFKEIITQLNNSLNEMQTKIDEINKTQAIINRRMNIYTKAKDEEERKRIIEDIGVTNEMIDINGNIIGLGKAAEPVFNFRKVILEYLDKDKDDVDPEEDIKEKQIDEINAKALERVFGTVDKD